MTVKAHIKAITEELGWHLEMLDSGQLEQFADEIMRATRIFAAGAGRSGLMVRAFAMRLMHLGKEVHVPGDVTAPKANAGDLLIIGSGSGETQSLVAAAHKAKACGMRLALNTIDGGSTLAKLADVAVILPGASQKVRREHRKTASVQPMGSSYEQLSLLVYDAVVMALMERLNKTADEMFLRHANLE